MEALDPKVIEAIRDSLTTRLAWSSYIPHQPTPKQRVFLSLKTREAFFGGAGGGGKSDALLMAALQYTNTPGYAALILRRSFADLVLPGALLDRSREWLTGRDCRYDGYTWHFPSGAKLTFGYLASPNDHYRYRSAEFQFIAFDELTQFSEFQYRYLFTRLRRLKVADVPLRMRSASNPGGEGHDWVRRRLVDGASPERPFIPARIADNPHLDAEGYRESLSHVDSVTRAQIEHGDWSVRRAGALFRSEWFEVVEAADLPTDLFTVRYWDLAATEPSGQGDDPDWTVGVSLARSGSTGIYYVLDCVRFRESAGARDRRVRAVATQDGTRTPIGIEQEPGSGGKAQVEYLRSRVLDGWHTVADRPTGPLIVRAGPVASQAQLGRVKLVRGPWIMDYLDELDAFPEGPHDDIVASLSGAFKMHTELGGGLGITLGAR